MCIGYTPKKESGINKRDNGNEGPFPKLCAGCASGGDVVLAGKSLVEKGIVERKWSSIGFIWELVSDPEDEKQ